MLVVGQSSSVSPLNNTHPPSGAQEGECSAGEECLHIGRAGPRGRRVLGSRGGRGVVSD